MNPELPVSLMREGFAVFASVGGPFLAALLAVGLVVGIIQAATQIQDPAVGFLPRLATGLVVSFVAGGWAIERLASYLNLAFHRMSQHL